MPAADKEDDLGNVYELLGVEEDASEKDIQGAYRRLSKKCHPDKNPDDPDAAEKFDRLTRAKDYLLNPIKRAEFDRKLNAERELQKRFANESAKRRKMREELESREEQAAARSATLRPHIGADDARLRSVQLDFAAKVKAREAKLSERQACVVAAATEVRADAEVRFAEARVRVVWRGEGTASTGVDVIRATLSSFGVQGMEVGEDCTTVQLGSREDALRAVLHCRERKHQLPFRVSLAPAKEKGGKPVEGKRENSEPGPTCLPPSSRQGGQGDGTPRETSAKGPTSGTRPTSGSFDDWEAAMLANIASLAAAQTVMGT